jgi:hypothetical protein
VHRALSALGILTDELHVHSAPSALGILIELRVHRVQTHCLFVDRGRALMSCSCNAYMETHNW